VVALALVVIGMLGIAAGIIAGRWSARRQAGTGVAAPNTAQPPPDVDTESLRLLGEAVEHLEIGVLVAGDSGETRYRNAAASSFRGTHVGLLVDDHVERAVRAALGGAANVQTVEFQGPPKRWLEISAAAVPAGGAVVTIRDVGERVRTDAMRSDFVTNVSHELKTPVGAVAVLAETLVGETDPKVIDRLSDHLVEEAHRAVRTIDDLLTLSEIESTRPGDEIVDLASVVRAAVARGQVVNGERGVEISSLDIPDGLLLRGDERQLLSAVGNLVENAVKYSHQGDVVQVRVRVDGSSVEVMVADQGVGIPRRDLDRVFERFYRIDRARGRDTGGTGLGLAIVRHVATNHGGDVHVSSEEGEGSTFVLLLPASLVVDQGARSTVGSDQVQHE